MSSNQLKHECLRDESEKIAAQIKIFADKEDIPAELVARMVVDQIVGKPVLSKDYLEINMSQPGRRTAGWIKHCSFFIENFFKRKQPSSPGKKTLVQQILERQEKG